MSNKSEIEELREIVKHQSAELAAVKQQLSPVMPSEKEVAAHRDAAHQARERQMSRAAYFSPEDLRAMRAAAPDDVCRDLATDARAPLTPRSIIPASQPTSNARVPVNTTGWQHQIQLRNGLGQGK